MNNATATPASSEAATVVTVLAAVAEAVRAAGEIPSGHLYVQCMGHMSLSTFSRMLGTLKGAGLVEETGYLLRWVGPKADADQPCEGERWCPDQATSVVNMAKLSRNEHAHPVPMCDACRQFTEEYWARMSAEERI
jgi:hypothetical protein